MAKDKKKDRKKGSGKKGKKKKKVLYKVKHSPVHGYGVFAATKLKKGTRILEYKGERVSHEEAERRYDDAENEHAHIVLFAVDENTVIDGKADGNDARFVNHSCDPNCEAVNEDGRIYIYSLKKIKKGQELFYDYSLELDEDFDEEFSHLYACHCGAKNCRGVMLAEAE